MLIRVLLAASIATCSPALADHLGDPMTFRYYDHWGPNPPAIQADGDITPDSPKEILQVITAHHVAPGTQIFFTSGGGDVKGGMEIGRIIRQYRLNVILEAHEPISDKTRQLLRDQYSIVMMQDDIPIDMAKQLGTYYTSYCASSCTFAFLGGVERIMGLGGIYAVHQFHYGICDIDKTQDICVNVEKAMSDTQRQSADLAVYLEEMGIPESFLQDMVLSDPHHLTVLTNEQLKKYNICSWTNKDFDGSGGCYNIGGGG